MPGKGRGMGGPSIAIVGSGFSGIGLAIGLRRAGFTELTVFERAADVGGGAVGGGRPSFGFGVVPPGWL